ncbi:MAG TPA: helix-turn-helix domain-containing protein [Phycisphaerae bacterium]|nr:helix-turn-helix domain-containing protein [Phycisphaerae bacterium]
MENLLTVNDLAAMLKFHRRTIERMATAGELPAPVHVRGRRRWRPEEIHRWLEGKAPQRIRPAGKTEIVTLPELARLLGVHRRTVERMAQAGELPAPEVIGRRRYWRTAEIERAVGIGAGERSLTSAEN